METNETFIRLYETYFSRLLFHASRFVENEAEAEDIVSDVFADLYDKQDTVDFEKGIVSYLYRAVTTRSLNLLRHKNIAAVRMETLEAINDRRLEFIDNTTPHETVENRDIEQGINEALLQLPDKCREAFRLSYIHGLKSKEIADTMNISVRTVEAHIYKALRILREKLKYLLVLTLLFLTK